MPGITTPITEREKAAIFAYTYGLLPDITTAYIIADDNTLKHTKSLVGLSVMVGRWRNSEKFKTYQEYCKKLILEKEAEAVQRGRDAERQEEQRNEWSGESERRKARKGQESNKMDFSDPAARKALYNKIIADASDDPKTQLDAAKLIEQTQKEDRQAAREGKTVRVYLPLTCDSCPLMEKAKKKAEKST